MTQKDDTPTRLPQNLFRKAYSLGYRDGSQNRWMSSRIEIPPAGIPVNISYFDGISLNPQVAQAMYDRYSQMWKLAYGKGAGRMIQKRAVMAWQPLPAPYHPDVNDAEGWRSIYEDQLEEDKAMGITKAPTNRI